MTSYPSNFATRPCDRDLLSRLEEAGCPPTFSELMLYRIWQDFASGGSDRRLLQTEDAGSGDRTIALLEKFCGWHETDQPPGLLVSLAIGADFLAVEPATDGSYLVCRDFYPINSKFSSGGKSMQRKGALTRVLTRELESADKQAAEHLQLWERNTASNFELGTPEQREQALLFLHAVCNSAGKSMPADSALRGGLFNAALKCLDTPPAARKDTLLYLISLRKDQSLPADVAAILHTWPALVAKAKCEGV